MPDALVIVLALIIGLIEIIIGGFIFFTLADNAVEVIETTRLLQIGIGVIAFIIIVLVLLVLVIGIGMETLELLYTVFGWEMPQAIVEWSSIQ